MQWITKPATLDHYDIKVELTEIAGETFATLWVGGRCRRKRGYLWTKTEAFRLDEGAYTIHDAVMHISMAAEQDRPVTQAQLERALLGANYEQEEFPF